MYFIRYFEQEDDTEQIKHFFNAEGLFTWLNKYQRQFGCLPPKLSIYKAECVLDQGEN